MNKTFTNSRMIGNYIISKNLGEGTFGKVKLGIHSQTQEKVAIKILEKNKITDVADVERVTRQINILKQVRHPNIIQLYEIIETPKQLFLVMEYVSEGELFQYIVKKKRLKESQACEFFQQIITGVEYLHQLGIVHRDLKPENLLIDFNRRLKLVDFGLSNTYKILSSQLQPQGTSINHPSQKDLLKTACGSPCYAAPEMIAGKKYQGLNADIWSCGIILFAMVCGYLPFEDPNTSALYKKIISGEFSIPKFVSSSCKQLLRGILTTDPNRRFTLKQIREHQWFKQISNNPFYNPQKPPTGIFTNKFCIPVDQFIIDEVVEFEQTLGFDEIKKYINNNRHNHVVTTYYLLLKKNLRLGIQSPSDICSNIFNQQLLTLKQANEENQRGTTAVRKQKVRDKQKQKQKEDSVTNNSKNETTDLQSFNSRTTTARMPTRTINRINLRDFSQKNNYTSRKKDQSVDFKLDIDNLPIVQNSVTLNAADPKRRKLNNRSINQKKDGTATVNFYNIEESFRATHFPNTSFNRTQYNGAPKQPITNKPPISFRTSLDRYQQKPQHQPKTSITNKTRYISLDASNAEHHQNNGETSPRMKDQMNKTFLGRMSRNTDNIPKWSDQTQRIRSILNKTITGHGTRKRKSVQY